MAQRYTPALKQFVGKPFKISDPLKPLETGPVKPIKWQLAAAETPPAVTHTTKHRRHGLTPVSATVHAAPTANAAATGLGLALERALCEMVGCSLGLSQSSSGRRAAFRITLPLASRAAELAAQFLVLSVDVSPIDSAGNAGGGSRVISSV